MLKHLLFGISLGAIGLSLLVPAHAAAPAKISSVAPVGDLVAQADARIKSLEESLASDQSYLQGKVTSIPQDAGVLAVLSQAIVESDEKAPWQAAAADVRDAAISVATSKSYDDAKKGLSAIKQAHDGGKTGSAKPEHDWNKLCRLGLLMKEVNKRNGKIRSGVRKKSLTDEDAAELAGSATVLAVLALAAHDDTHEVKSKKKEDIDEWQKYAKEFQAEMTATAAALKKKDVTAAADSWKKGNAACNSCHDKFRKES